MNTYNKIQTISNRSAAEMTFAAYSNPAIRIVVTKVADGTENQQAYANSLKMQAMSKVDEVAATLVRQGAIPEKAAAWRDALMAAIDAETGARSAIENLKDTYKSAEKLAVQYGVLP